MNSFQRGSSEAHLKTAFLAASVSFAVWRCGKAGEEWKDMEGATDDITFFAQTNWRGEGKLFGIRQADRLHHMYVIGKTGTGKSTMMKTMIAQDIAAGRGAALLDPHGDLVEDLVASFPEERTDDLIYFDVPDVELALGYNPFANVPPEKRSLAASGILEVFKKLWADSWGPRLEHILRNAIMALLEQPEATRADIPRLFATERVSNARVREFWLREFEGYPARLRGEAIAPVQNKVGAFLADGLLREVLTRRDKNLDLREVMDEGRILLVNLAKGKVGEDAAALLGSLLVSGIGVAALSRADRPERNRRPFFLFLDEFQSFTTLSLATMLSELRKYGVGLVLSHQYLTQLDERLQDAILGNADTIVCFRVGLADAEILGKEFWPEFRMSDLVALPNYEIYLKLMIDGRVSRGFSAETVVP